MVTVHFERYIGSSHESWELECDTLHEARELAEEFVDEGDADTATISRGWTEEEYSALGWSAY